MTNTKTTTKTNHYRRVLVALAVVAILASLLMMAATTRPAHATTTFLVNSTSDQPDANTTDDKCFALNASCTLRAAIQQANASPGADVINFSISGGEMHTITPSSPLPPITDPVTIDGYSQPGASPNTLGVGNNAVVKVGLDGSKTTGATSRVNGLTILNSSDSLIRGLVIDRFSGDGISISGDTSSGTTIANNNRIEGNFIGTDPSGTQDLGNSLNGVAIEDGSFSTVVGGSSPSARNLISGNGLQGVHIDDSSGTQVQGNYIGTDKSGMADLGNGGSGVVVGNRTFTTLIGGTTTGAGNVIAGNDRAGLGIIGSKGTRVLGNRIGVTASGTGALGNTEPGVVVGAANTSVGDGSREGSNTIAFNGDDGLLIAGLSTGNEVSRNSIFSNAGLGIDLIGGVENTAGVTANDPLDADPGANNLQNKPVLSSAKTVSGKATIQGKLDSVSNETYTIRFYSNPKDTNEGKKFVGEKSVTTSADGLRSFTFSPATSVAAGQAITATATRNSTHDTSEFSAARTVASS